jgi:hypothetical protein
MVEGIAPSPYRWTSSGSAPSSISTVLVDNLWITLRESSDVQNLGGHSVVLLFAAVCQGRCRRGRIGLPIRCSWSTLVNLDGSLHGIGDGQGDGGW